MIELPFMPRVLLLNGPPGSGKDALGSLLAELDPGVRLLKFAQPLIDTMEASFGVSCADGADKEAPCVALGGKSRREVAISLSETWFKPMFGSDIFGKILKGKIDAMPPGNIAVITDSGFKSEANPVISALPPGSVDMIQLSRSGTSFRDDSRGYWQDNRVGLTEIKNSGFITDLEREAMEIVSTWRQALC